MAHNTTPVQCQDDPYPSNAVVVSGEMSYKLRGCTSEMTGYWTYLRNDDINRNAGQRYGCGGNRPQHLERDGPHEEEEKNLALKGKKKPGMRRRKKSSYVSQ